MIRRRILEIMDEYDDRIDECVMVVENMFITMQTVSNVDNPPFALPFS